MPPASNARKSSTATMTMTEPHTFYNSSITTQSGLHPAVTNSSAALQPRRSNSGRAIRVNTTRPANYYARPFGSMNNSAGGAYGDHNLDSAGSGGPLAPAGIFPALQYFSDAITALPKEVMRQFTLMKEVEAKVHGPGEQLVELLDNLLHLPVPSRQEVAMIAALRGSGGSAATTATGTQGLVAGSTANNSVIGSANPSLINGVPGGHRSSVQLSATASVHSEDGMDTEEERIRRTRYHELRFLMHNMLANLDEKNVVLAEANRVLGLQEVRIASVMPHIENEISEEARLGSMTHWAYSDNRQKKQTGGNSAANRRDVAATHSLAAAASAIHEHDIAQARRDAGREAAREKGKNKRTEAPGDSDFDDKPRRGPKAGKGKANTSVPTTGLGISTNGEPAAKRKKTEKAITAVGMERTISATGRATKAAKDTPRSTPAAESNSKKAPKAKPMPPVPKKKPPPSAQASPMLVSSPLVTAFNPSLVEQLPPPNARPQSTRLRQNSNATHQRIEKMAVDEAGSRPSSAGGKINGTIDKPNGRRKAQEVSETHEEPVTEQQTTRQLNEASEQLRREDIEMRDADDEARPVPSRSNSSSQKNSGRGSKAGTPRNESFPEREVDMTRTRSTRSRPGTKGESRDSSSSEPQQAGPIHIKHRRMASNSNLVKQLAPFNRSPDLDRHRSRDDMEDELDSADEKAQMVDPPITTSEPVTTPVATIPESERETRRSSVRRPPRNLTTSSRYPSSAGREDASPEPVVTVAQPSTRNRQPTTPATPVAMNAPIPSLIITAIKPKVSIEEEQEALNDAEDDEEDDGSEHDPDDPNEPKYCYCNRGSYGEMIACDGDNCPGEWFHLGCTGLREAPDEEKKWYCRDCLPKYMRKGRGGRGTGGRG